MIRDAVSFLLCALPTLAAAETLSGLPYLTDADTVIIHGTKIRLAGIDAPEMGQTCLDNAGMPYRCGVASREALTAFAAGKEWRCELQATPDRYGRRVGACFVDAPSPPSGRRSTPPRLKGEDIQRWLVRSGWAIDYPKYSHGLYARDEAAARAGRRGMWAGSFMAPWHVRHHECDAEILGEGPMPVDGKERLCR